MFSTKMQEQNINYRTRVGGAGGCVAVGGVGRCGWVLATLHASWSDRVERREERPTPRATYDGTEDTPAGRDGQVLSLRHNRACDGGRAGPPERVRRRAKTDE